MFFSCFSADFEFEKSEVAYREKVLKNLEEYINQIFPGKCTCMVWHNHYHDHIFYEIELCVSWPFS